MPPAAARGWNLFSPWSVSLAMAIAAWLAFGPLAAAQPGGGQMPPSRVRVGPVVQRELSVGRTFVGSIEAVQTSTVGGMFEGRVEQLLVDEGQRVEKGAEIARLRDIQVKLRLAVAEKQAELSEQALSELLVVLPEEIEQARAKAVSAEALRKFAEARLQRARVLAKSNSISEEELQERESAAAAAAEKVAETRAAWRAAAESREEREAKARLELLVQQEEVKRLKDELAEHTIVAPFTGHVTRKHTEVGQWLAKGGPVVEMVNIDQVDVEVPVPERYFARLRPGMLARVTVDAIPGWSKEEPISVVVPQADERSRTFRVKVRLTNEPGDDGVPPLGPGMFAQIALPVGEQDQVMLVPKDAVVPGGEVPVVYAVDPMPPSPAGGERSKKPSGPPAGPPGAPPMDPPDAKARWVPVELGAAVDGLIEVRSPLLKPDDRVVVEGNERLFPGAPLIVMDGGEATP